jgi:hypothetical protein
MSASLAFEFIVSGLVAATVYQRPRDGNAARPDVMVTQLTVRTPAVPQSQRAEELRNSGGVNCGELVASATKKSDANVKEVI